MTQAESAAKYLALHRDEVNLRRRARYWLNVEIERARLRARARELRATSPEYRSKVATAARKSHLWTLYRLTPEDYAAIEMYQGGVCAACGQPSERIRLAVDHDHATGRIRGLLCWVCNRALGFIRDRRDVAEGLALYLMEPPAPLALGKETYGLIGKALKSKKHKVYGPPQAVTVGKGIK